MSSSAITTARRRRGALLAAIADAARPARRDPADITLIAVSKTRPVEAIEALLDTGQRDFGESRVQEAQAKWTGLRRRHPDVRLHLIGRLQSNKVSEAVDLFNTIHSLDRASLLDALVGAAEKAGRTPSVYIQVNISEEEQKGGIALADLPAFIDRVRASPVPLAGLMGIPPLSAEPGPYFALLAKLAIRHGVSDLSMGMSRDFRSAVMLGSTALRIGTAFFED